jgi:hypothetical protein
MFADINHPSDTLMYKICCEVCQLLNISVNYEYEHMNIGIETIVAPCVKKALQCRYECNPMRKGNTRAILMEGTSELTIEEYIREYVWIYYDRLII